MNYLAPQFRNRDNLSLSLSAIAETSNDVRTFNSQRLEGASELSWRRSRATTIQYRYVFRRVNLNELKISPDLIPLSSRPVRVGLVSSTLIFDRRDDPVESHRGYYNTLDLGLAVPAFGSQYSFVRQLFRNSTYHRLGREFVLARSILFGTISPFQTNPNLLEFPLSEKFFAGGASSHRAFPENQAGPRDLVTGFPIGGRALLMHNLEARFPLLGDNVGGVLFYDVGNVYSEFSKISFRATQRDLTDFDYAVQAVGLGLRLRTPIGPIRVDLSYGLNSPRFFGFQGSLEDLIAGQGRQVVQRIHPFQFHFSLGQTF
jgi:outer membrane protein assembly factor BamA